MGGAHLVLFTFAFFVQPACSENSCLKSHELAQVVFFAEVEKILLYLIPIGVEAVPLGVRLEAEGIRM